MSTTRRETIHRSSNTMELMRQARVAICGCGALGANLAETLARMGYQNLTLIDHDRVEEHNLSTQPFGLREIGQPKAQMMANALYRDVGAEVEAHVVSLGVKNAEALLSAHDIIVDAFDNSTSRKLVKHTAKQLGIPCLHMGMASGYSEVIWDPAYVVPQDAGVDQCDYPLGRTLVTATVSLGAELLTRFVARGEMDSVSWTMEDFKAHAV